MTCARRVAADRAGLAKAARVLRDGGIVALPTETFYGLAASAGHPAALGRLSALKERPPEAPFPLLVSGWSGSAGAERLLADDLAPAQLARARSLADRFWPGPLTLVLPARAQLDAALVGAGGGVGIRWSPEPIVQQLLAALAGPITATSANRRGAPAPRTADEVAAGVGGCIDLIVAGTAAPGGLPSTVLQVDRAGGLRVLRPGRLPLPLLQDPEGHSLDALRRGRVVFVQPRRRGLRVSVDPVLLALFLYGREIAGPLVDLGTGVGIIPLLLASDGAAGPFVGVELQEDLAALARENVRLNGMSPAAFRIVQADLRDLSGCCRDGEAAWVVSNPPYHPPARGKPSPRPHRSVACHELTCTLPEIVESAARLLRPGGSFALVQRADREQEAVKVLARNGLKLVRLRRVVARPGRSPRHVLLEACRTTAERACVREPDLTLRGVRGQAYCPEVGDWLEGGPPGPRGTE